MKKKLLLCVLVLHLACGKKGNQSGMADREALFNVDAFAEKSNVGKIECDGEGTEFSGLYLFNFSDNKMKCSNTKEVKLGSLSTKYKCIQDNKNFSCENVAATSDKFSGCIGKDAKFKLTLGAAPAEAQPAVSTTEASSTKPVTTSVPAAPTTSATSSSGLNGFIVGTLNKPDGKVQYSIVSQNSQAGVCVSTSKLEVQQVSQ